ncbi:pectate lyase [Rhizoctonia solani]|uniref:Pectate lyase n=1 Tax=Rhizoctonia solani TaxID=456999 RepID=A0A8H8T0Y1_9AGAM|nr:pectate lyase [Rhizoctonia solani]QRW23938.1 pectate lyase [Rhizoctonia solani]
MLTLNVAITLLAGLSAATPTKRAAPVDGIAGYATLNGGTTGGAGGATTTVTTLAALRSAVAGTSPKVVKISGIITGDGKVVDVGSETTVLGAGSDSGLIGGGFRVKNGKNVIIRNLRLSKSPAPTDLIGLQNATNVWIDHNTFTSDLDHGKDFYDGQCDITHASDFVTVSWNVFTEHFKVSLVGHLTTTVPRTLAIQGHLPSQLFPTCQLPSSFPPLRHIYNNYFKNVLNSGVDSRDGAQTLVENVLLPIETALNGGFAVQRNNLLINTTMDSDLVQGTLTTVPYTYTLDEASTIAEIVAKSAGAGVITF